MNSSNGIKKINASYKRHNDGVLYMYDFVSINFGVEGDSQVNDHYSLVYKNGVWSSFQVLNIQYNT